MRSRWLRSMSSLVGGFYAKPSFSRISADDLFRRRCDFNRHRFVRVFQIRELSGQNLSPRQSVLPRPQSFAISSSGCPLR